MFRRAASTIMAVAILGSVVSPTAAAPDGAAVADFDAFVAEVGETMLSRFPEDVTDLGLSAHLGQGDDGLNDLSQSYRLETARLAQDALDRMATIDRDALTPDQRITFAVSEWYLDDIVSMTDHLDHEYAVNYITGAHANFPEFMVDVHPITNATEAEAYVERLRGSAVQLQQVADNLARSERAGNLPTARGIGIARWQIDNQLTSGATHPLVTDLEARLAELDLADSERDRILDDARIAFDDDVLPAYQELLDVVSAAATRSDDRPGVLHHPDGEAYYAAAVRHHTTTSLTPQDIHQVGLDEVQRVRGELTDVLTTADFDVEKLGFTGAIEAARAATPPVPLHSDEDRAALLEATEAFVTDAQSAFTSMFTTVPSSAIEVQRPRPSNEGGAGAYYRAPPAVGERPGIYYLSLGGDSFEMSTYATTNYHEAVPGHHFQIALQRESRDLPLIQRATGFNGYAEGWALYAERLAHEAGLYDDDPLGNIGRLRMELLRAARVVADTGIHALGWPRSQAIEYLVELGFPEPWAASEVDRYVVWPGQAPAYLIGMLEILRLRADAEAALGDDFDLAAFHDAVLRHGSVPVEVLGQIIGDHIEAAI